MCKYCDNRLANIAIKDKESQGLSLILDGNIATVFYEAQYIEDCLEGETGFEFKFCPMCGKKLIKE